MLARAIVVLLSLLPAPEPDPPLSDLDRFPPAEVVAGKIAFYTAQVEYLDVASNLAAECNRQGLWDTRKEASYCLEAWQMLQMAQVEGYEGAYYSDDYRSQVLGDLRRHLGRRNYLLGRMPEVPLHRFRRLD